MPATGNVRIRTFVQEITTKLHNDEPGASNMTGETPYSFVTLVQADPVSKYLHTIKAAVGRPKQTAASYLVIFVIVSTTSLHLRDQRTPFSVEEQLLAKHAQCAGWAMPKTL
jgi:hypothetical protein